MQRADSRAAPGISPATGRTYICVHTPDICSSMLTWNNMLIIRYMLPLPYSWHMYNTYVAYTCDHTQMWPTHVHMLWTYIQGILHMLQHLLNIHPHIMMSWHMWTVVYMCLKICQSMSAFVVFAINSAVGQWRDQTLLVKACHVSWRDNSGLELACRWLIVRSSVTSEVCGIWKPKID